MAPYQNYYFCPFFFKDIQGGQGPAHQVAGGRSQTAYVCQPDFAAPLVPASCRLAPRYFTQEHPGQYEEKQTQVEEAGQRFTGKAVPEPSQPHVELAH